MYKYRVTVFTSTYNRAYLIENLYNSLKRQTCKEFEWIVVDDGSTDGTAELLTQWVLEENEFNIIYMKVKNGGKHRAINKGTDLANGELFLMVDSDDYLVDNAIQKIVSWRETIREMTGFCGIAGNKGYEEKTMIGESFEGDYIDATSLERDKYNIKGDKAEIFYTQILQKYKFPEINGENFMTESVVWNAIANDGFKLRWFNEIIYIAHYLTDGLTYHAQEIALKNPKGYLLSNKQNHFFYMNYLEKEKEELFKIIESCLLGGELDRALKEIEKKENILNKDEEFIIVKYQILIYKNEVAEAEKVLEVGQKIIPKSIKIYEKLSEIYEEQGRIDKLIDLNQKYLFVVENPNLKKDILEKLNKKYGVEESKIRYLFQLRLKEEIENGNIERGDKRVLECEWIENLYKEEHLFYDSKVYLQEFILRLLTNLVLGYSVQQEYYSYIYGNTYFLYGQLENAYHEYMKIPQEEQSPLVKHNLSVIRTLIESLAIK